MARRRAKMIEDRQLELALLSIKGSDTEKRDKVFLLFSCKAGLRAQEIALMPWSNVTDGEGSIGTEIRVDSYIAKGHRERTIPMHRDLYNALSELRMERPQDKFVAYSIRPGFKYMTANAMAQWFRRFYAGLGFDSTSSHSGRRTFCTKASRKCNLVGASLKDVQKMMGHARLDTTERYLEYSDQAVDLVNLI